MSEMELIQEFEGFGQCTYMDEAGKDQKICTGFNLNRGNFSSDFITELAGEGIFEDLTQDSCTEIWG